MAKLLSRFNANNVDPTQSAGSLPIGRHPVVIAESDVEGTKGGQGGMLVLTLKIIDGPQAGVTGPYRLNLYNQSPIASKIAEQQLSAICHVINVMQEWDDPAVLHNKPFMIDVGFQKGHEPNPNNPEAKGYTEVKKVFDINGNEPGKKGNQQQTNNAGQFDNQMADHQRKEEQRMAGGPGGGSAQNWGNQSNGQQQGNANQGQGNWGNQSNNQGGEQTGNQSGNWGNNGGQQTQQNQGGNGQNWGGNNGGNAGGQTQSNGGGSWQQNTNGAQGGGNSNGGWGQRN